jgi:hypothetical protein
LPKKGEESEKREEEEAKNYVSISPEPNRRNKAKFFQHMNIS